MEKYHAQQLMFLLPVFALAGCATGPSLQSRMAAYIGDNTQTLVQGLGVPDKQITVNDGQYLAYNRSYDEIMADDVYFGGYPIITGRAIALRPPCMNMAAKRRFF